MDSCCFCVSTARCFAELLAVAAGQKTLTKLDSNVAALEERLQYERQKLANYSKDLQHAEAR